MPKTFRYVGLPCHLSRHGQKQNGDLIIPKDEADEAGMLKSSDFEVVTPEDIAAEAEVKAEPAKPAPAPVKPAKPATVVKSVLAALVFLFAVLIPAKAQNVYVPEEFAFNSSNQLVMTTNLTFDGPVIDVTKADSIQIRAYGLATNGAGSGGPLTVGWVYGTTAQGPWPLTGETVDFSTTFLTPGTNWWVYGTNITLNDAGFIKAVAVRYYATNSSTRLRFLTGKKF